jgi:hypothetical protein
MSTVFVSPNWRMPRNANQSKQSNYSMDFDASSSQYVDTNFVPADNLTLDCSISAWVNMPAINNNTNSSILGTYDFTDNRPIGGQNRARFFLRILRTGGVYYYMIGLGTVQDTTVTISNFSANTWVHLAVTYDGTDIKLYSNGTLDGTLNAGNIGSYPPIIASFNGISYIGATHRSSGANTEAHITGKIDAVAIYNYPLSASQVTTLYGDSTNGSGNPMALPNPPIAYYPLGTSAWNGNFLAENNAIGDYVFDNINSSAINTPYNLTATSNITVSIWFKTTTNAQSNKYLFSYGNNQSIYDLRLNGTDAVQPIIKIAGSQRYPNISFNYADGNWHQYIVNYDGSHIKFYIDGILKNKTSATGNLSVGSTNFSFANISGNNGVVGEVSNCTIHTATLTDGNVSEGNVATGEIATFYNYGSPIKTLSSIPKNSNLDLWYKLDASEVYNSSTTEWEINEATSPWTSSLNFDGGIDKIDCGNDTSLNLTSEITLSAWVKTTDQDDTNNIIKKDDGAGNRSWNLSWRGSGGSGGSRLVFWNWSADGSYNYIYTTGTPASNFADGNWHHVVATYDGTTDTNGAKIYLDGFLMSQGFVSRTGTGLDTTTANVTIGNDLTASISNVQIFNTALPETGSNSVETLYNNGTPLSDMSSFTSLVSWWKLNNTTTGVEDSKGSNNGTNNGATDVYGSVSTLNGVSSGMSQANLVQSDLQTVAPYSKYALSFDGTNDYIDCGNDSSLKLASNFSISVWMKSSNQQSFAVAVGNNSVFSLQMSATLNKFRFNVYSSGWQEAYYSLNPIDDDKWHHVVATHDGSTIKVYVDNVKGTDASAGAIPSNTAPFLIGYLPGNAGLYFDGQISNVSYWNTALTQAQVTETYNEGLPSDLNSHSAYSNLVSWWQLGSNSSWNGNRWIVADGKGTNNGYSQNMAPYMPESGLTNGVGTTANGVSTGMGVGALVGDAPYSTSNAISSGMAVTARGTDVP